MGRCRTERDNHSESAGNRRPGQRRLVFARRPPDCRLLRPPSSGLRGSNFGHPPALRPRIFGLLRRCGDDLSRANVLKQATTLAGFHSPYFLDGINFSYTPEDYTPMKTLYISIFNGKDWDISDKPVTE